MSSKTPSNNQLQELNHLGLQDNSTESAQVCRISDIEELALKCKCKLCVYTQLGKFAEFESTSFMVNKGTLCVCVFQIWSGACGVLVMFGTHVIDNELEECPVLGTSNKSI